MFKVGDWVRYKDTLDIFQIKKDTQAFMIENNEDIYEVCELWKPEEGEICIFEQYALEYPIIARYTEKLKAESLRCEPFRGELPTFLEVNYGIK